MEIYVGMSASTVSLATWILCPFSLSPEIVSPWLQKDLLAGLNENLLQIPLPHTHFIGLPPQPVPHHACAYTHARTQWDVKRSRTVYGTTCKATNLSRSFISYLFVYGKMEDESVGMDRNKIFLFIENLPSPEAFFYTVWRFLPAQFYSSSLNELYLFSLDTF